MLIGDKMKRLLLIFLITTIPLAAQMVTVVEDAAVTNLKDGAFYYPAVSPDGTTLLFSSESYKGLGSKNL